MTKKKKFFFEKFHQFVSSIITSLRPTVIRIISTSVASSSVDLTNYQNLVEQIITRLRPVILSAVQALML